MRSLLMMTMLALAGAVGSAACGGAVRNANVLDQEIGLVSEFSARMAPELLEQAAASARVGDLARCAELADTALVAQTRVPYHAAMARFLFDRGKDPGPPPPIPRTEAWCAEQAAAKRAPIGHMCWGDQRPASARTLCSSQTATVRL